MLEKLNAMIAALEAVRNDAERHDLKQKAAGARIRKAMQVAKGQAQEIRKDVMTDQKSW